MVRTRALCDADFLEMLSETAAEYGFRNEGIIRIRCEIKSRSSEHDSNGGPHSGDVGHQKLRLSDGALD
nr:auxin-responsive protein SAUR71-like [Ipomoea batatas]GME07862.1 auxin-responsive protein SAUR71-like [Ipomoea batatas]